MIKIPLTKGAFTIVDDEDFELVSDRSWYFTSTGYAANKRKDGIKYMHRVIANCPEGMLVDHIDGDRLNNRRSNLRIVTFSQNHMNRHVKRQGTYSKYKGVSKRSGAEGWRAYIKVNRKDVNLGNFDSEEDAARAYNAAALKYFGEYSYLNNIEEVDRMDKLTQMYDMQMKLDERIKSERNVNKSMDEWVVGLTLAMESEIDEIRREINWKWWKNPKEVDIEALQGEVIDIWHFLLSLSREVGLSPDDIHRVYMEKNAENHARQSGTSDKEGYTV